LWPVHSAGFAFLGIDANAEIDDFFAAEPGGMIHAMACS